MGAAELERLERDRKTVTVHNPGHTKIIKECLDVDVYTFTFSSTGITSILAAISIELCERLQRLGPVPISESAPHGDARPGRDVIELRPNFWGIGIDVRALWRNVRNR